MTDGPQHADGATVAPSTQETYPWRAALRTGLQVAIVLIVAFPAVVEIVNAELSAQLPDSWELWLAAASATVTALTITVTRLMQLPGISGLLTKIGFGPEPKA